MSQKQVIFVIGVGFAILILTIGSVWFKVKSLMAEGVQMITEAEEFGKTASDVQCVKEAISRFEGCDDEICEMMATPFAANCLVEARHTEQLCQGVPSLQGGDQGESWRRQRCSEVIGGSDSEACQGIFFVVQANCDDR